jgi:hypothetical protein
MHYSHLEYKFVQMLAERIMGRCSVWARALPVFLCFLILHLHHYHYHYHYYYSAILDLK